MVRYKICRLLEHRSVGLSQVINAQPHSCDWGTLPEMAEGNRIYFLKRNAPSNFLQPVLNVSRVWPRDLEPLGGDFDCAKSAPLREIKNKSYYPQPFLSEVLCQSQESATPDAAAYSLLATAVINVFFMMS